MEGHIDDCNCDHCEAIHLCLNENQKKEREQNLFQMFCEEGQEPASQLIVSSDDEGPEQDNVDIDLVTPKAPRKAAGKRPMSARKFLDLEAEEDDDVPPSSEDDFNGYVWTPTRKRKGVHEDSTPDLEAYFRQFPMMSNFTKISVCRAYANHLNAVERAKKESSHKKAAKRASELK